MSYRPQVKADSNGTTQDLPIDAETVQGKTPVFTTTNQIIKGVKTYDAPTNVSDSEQTTTKFKTSNGGAIILGKEGPNSGTMIRLDQKDGTCRLRFRSSAIAGAMVWEQPEQGAKLYIDLGKEGADKHRISFPSSAGTLALKSQIPTKVSELTNDSGYINNVSIAPSSSGSKSVSGPTGNLSADFGDGPFYPVSGTTNIGIGLDEKNITITPGEGAKRAEGSYDSSTGDYSWTLDGTTGNSTAHGLITWKSGDNQLKITKNGTTSTVGYFNSINGQSVISSDSSKNFSFYTKTETDNKYLPLSGGTLTGNLTGKYITGTWLQTTLASDLGKAPPKYGVIDANGWLYTRTLEETKSDLGINSKSPVESVIDYGDTNKTIKIGYSGAGLSASQILYIAGYTAGANGNEHKIKDISKDVLKSWLGYSEVSTGMWSPGSTWTGTSGYVWIIYPYDSSANTFKFTYGSGDRTGYGFAILQGEGCIRYFQSTTQLTRSSTSSITFSTQMRYIKFKMGG